MGVAQWFKQRHMETQRLKADAMHMRERYGSKAVEMCEFAIASAQDGSLRQKLRVIRRMLVQQGRTGRTAL